MERKAAEVYAPFPTTRWSLVARVGHVETSVKRRALNDLLQRYMPAIRSHLTLRKRVRADQVDDLMQGFLASQVIEKDLITRVEREKGKLRTFILTALDHYISKQYRHQGVRRRRLGSKVDMDEMPEIASSDAGSSATDRVFDVEWARSVLSQTLERMWQKCQSSGRQDVWHVFEYRVLRPMLHGDPAPPYEQMVDQFQFRSPAQVSNLLVTGKRMFVRLMRAVVAEYVVDEEQIDQEIADLRRILSGIS